MILKELLWAGGEAKLLSRKVAGMQMWGKVYCSCWSLQVSQPLQTVLRVQTSLEVQADIMTKREKFEQIELHSPGYFPREVSC